MRIVRLNFSFGGTLSDLIFQFHSKFNKLTSIFYASVLLLIMNFVITLSK